MCGNRVAQAGVCDAAERCFGGADHEAAVRSDSVGAGGGAEAVDGVLYSLLGSHEVVARRLYGHVDIVNLGHGLVELVVLFFRFPEGLDVGIGKFDVVVADRAGVFDHVCDLACGGVVVIEAFCVEFVVGI